MTLSGNNARNSLIAKHLSSSKQLSERKGYGLFNEICVLPNVAFETQEANEIPVLLVRRHPIFLIINIISSLGWFIIALVLNYALQIVLKSAFSPVFLSKLSLFVILLGLIASFTAAVYSYVKWYYNILMVTTKRIIDIDFHGFLSTSWTEAPLTSIEDIEFKQTSLLSYLFDTGSLYIQTAGAQAKLEIRNIPRPLKVQDIIMDLVETVKKNG